MEDISFFMLHIIVNAILVMLWSVSLITVKSMVKQSFYGPKQNLRVPAG